MSLQEWITILTIVVYNLAIIVSLMAMGTTIKIKDMLQDKEFVMKQHALAITAASAARDAAVSSVAANTAAAADKTSQVAADTAVSAAATATNAAAVVQSATSNLNDGAGTSYSRITGFAGTVVLTCFIWALGDAVIYNAYMAPGNVKDMLSGVGPFILAGSALFAPYAFNQLSTVFPPKTS
jgi:hypothetical protein